MASALGCRILIADGDEVNSPVPLHCNERTNIFLLAYYNRYSTRVSLFSWESNITIASVNVLNDRLAESIRKVPIY